MSLYAYKYYLTWGGEIIYAGVTDDPQRRLDEHRKKNFPGAYMQLEGDMVLRQEALAWEKQQRLNGIPTE